MRRGDRGQAAAELALTFPLVIAALMCVVQVGVVIRDQVLVVHAAREAVRRAAIAIDPADRDGEATAGALEASGLRRLDVDTQVHGDRVTVTVAYAAPTDLPIVGALVGSVHVKASATMRLER